MCASGVCTAVSVGAQTWVRICTGGRVRSPRAQQLCSRPWAAPVRGTQPVPLPAWPAWRQPVSQGREGKACAGRDASSTSPVSLRVLLDPPSSCSALCSAGCLLSPRRCHSPVSIRGCRREPGMPLVAPGQVHKSQRVQSSASAHYRAEKLLAWGKQHQTVAKCHQQLEIVAFIWIRGRLSLNWLLWRWKQKTRAVSQRFWGKGRVKNCNAFLRAADILQTTPGL